MKKALALMLCLIMAISLLAACGGQEDDTPQTDETGRPIVTIGIPENPSIIYKDNTYTALLEKISGCKIEYVFFANAAADYTQQLSTRTAADEELPDILWGFRALDEETRNKYGQDEYFIDLLPLLMDKEKSATFWERFERADEAVQRKVLADMVDPETGEAYGFPAVLFPNHDFCSYMVSINQEWLTKLNKKNPTNIEELEDVLRAFRDQDPNGNGLKDEIPLIGQNNGTGARSMDFFINLFTYYNTQDGYFQVDDNGKVVCTAKTEAYRDALKWVYRMVKEGLIHENTFTNTQGDIQYYFVSNIDRIGVVVTHPQIGMVTTNDMIQKFVALDCIKYAPILQGQHTYNTHITSSCKDVDAAWKVIMAMNTEEAILHNGYGVYGENWTDADPGSKSADGYDARIKILDADDVPTKNRWGHNAVGVLFSAPEQKVVDPNANPNQVYQMEGILLDIVATYKEAAEKNNPDAKNICPKLIFNAQDRLDAPGYAAIPNEITKWQGYFMSGTLDPNDEAAWQRFMTALDKAGIKDYMEVAQIVYERTMASYS